MKKNLFFLSLVFIAAGLLVSCGKYPGFKKTDTGLFYKFHVESGDTAKPRVNDLMKLALSYGTKDSTLMPVTDNFMLPLLAPMFKGDIYEGFAMMAKGDSATFIVQADSFYTKIVRQPRPEFIDSTAVLYFQVKMIEFMSQEEMMKRKQEENAALEQEEMKKMTDYLTANNITTQPTASGIIYIETKKGNGAKPTIGKSVKVHYTGTLLDGTKFDSSFDHPNQEPIEFEIGTGRVIQGWEEGIAMMNKGGKARLIIPSKLAYGERAQGPIPAFSTLVFEVELVDVAK
ncbi:MAG: FKBP-type peptidyl-prolyl cis-trans isomerase [Bacteroidales bacterium]|nr:FKBP-type peptidyl-prolyl cis-trans isomerase [Bacteroidales bacterium]